MGSISDHDPHIPAVRNVGPVSSDLFAHTVMNFSQHHLPDSIAVFIPEDDIAPGLLRFGSCAGSECQRRRFFF